MQPNVWRYREGYLAARAAKEDFVARFYLNLIPPADQAALIVRADIDALTSLLELANEHRRTGKLDEALPLFIEIANVKKAKLGAEDPDALDALNLVGVVHWQMGQFEKSAAVFEDLLNIREAKLGRDHRDTVLAKANLGVNYKDAGKVTEAISLLEEAYRAVMHEPNLGWVEFQLFDAYMRVDPELAAKHLAALIPTLRTELGEDHVTTLVAMNNFGYFLARSGQFIEAEAVLKETIEREVRTLGEEDMLLLQTRTNLGELYQLQSLHALAEELLRKCLAERAKKEPNSFRLASTQSMLGRVLAEEERFVEAESLLLAGCNGLKDNSGATPVWGRYYLPDTLQWLTELYEAWGKPDEAAKWRKELEATGATQPSEEQRS